ncbi:glycosyltransferase family 4 protein [Nitrosovibrio sp. Nv6]|uniref:glycosyltransferase family 4 protein n=1 Tax=Nitrosovibrio sp. Nv6 TaxID=1855340 RepID=UPI0008C995C8|nr:glycosyltransferase family 4 protein [Nitrosovibrio sp. Nv6]SEO52304.1 Glycosyltransferase involved in cell wall bisynthesis [Nitrosovibrio sp. Nv6]
MKEKKTLTAFASVPDLRIGVPVKTCAPPLATEKNWLMRVCFISHSAGRYGAELALLELLQGLVKLNVRCLVLVPEKGPLLAQLNLLNIEWQIIKYPPWISQRKWMLTPYRIVRTLKALVVAVQMAQVIKRWNCDLVYTNTAVVGAGAFAAWLACRPHIWHSHESGYHNPSLKFDLGSRWVARLMDHFSALIIVNSYSVKEDYARYIEPGRMHLVYQSVTLREEIEISQRRIDATEPLFRCAIVGSLHAWKGQDEAINALSEVVRRGINAHLLLVGDGGKRFAAALLQQIKDLGLEERVKLIGYAENPLQFICMADVVLVCSRWEAFGRVTVEAMLAGKAVIGSSNGGTTELIQDGKTGLLYERGNHTQLADRIQYLYENPEVKSKLGEAARIWAASRFTQERYAKEVLDLLKGVLAREKISPQIPSN